MSANPSLTQYIEDRLKALNAMRVFADRESKLAFDNMINELTQVKVRLDAVKGYIDQNYDLCAELCTYDGGKEEAAYDIYKRL